MSSATRDQLLPCYVVHRRDYGNTSLLVELFSRDAGRFPALAKGAKRPRAAGAALLQPFQPLLVSVTGRGEVRTLARVEADGRVPALAGPALYCGFYVNELIARLLGRCDPHERLYAHYARTLADLAGAADAGGLLRRFELRLLEEIGYAPVLDRDAEQGAPVRPEARYGYDPDRGPLAGAAAGGFSVSGRTLLALADGADLDPFAGREARELLRRILARYLGERPLKSRELFRQLLSVGGPAP